MSNPNITELVDRYLATWNEADDARRRDLIARTFAPAARYVDPLAMTTGPAELDALIRAVQARFPGLAFVRAASPDHHGSFVRFSWHLAPSGGAPVAGGTDFGVVDSDGRFASVTGFLDAVAAP